MGEKRLSSDTLWTVDSDQPRYIWVGCSPFPPPGHARPVYPQQVEEDVLLCEQCREPQVPLSKTAVERYKRGDRRCGSCQIDDHTSCTGVGCYGCPPEFHRRVGVVATRTTNGDVGR